MSLVAIVKEEFPHILKCESGSKNVNPKQYLFELQAVFALIMESDWNSFAGLKLQKPINLWYSSEILI